MKTRETRLAELEEAQRAQEAMVEEAAEINITLTSVVVPPRPIPKSFACVRHDLCSSVFLCSADRSVDHHTPFK